MAGTKVKDLTLKSVLSSTDEFYINDVENGNLDKKTTVGDINNFILPIAISDVTSLQTSLDGKSAVGHTHVLANITDVTITATNLNTLDDGVNTTLHFHDSDRARANHTGTQLKATISDFAHTHPLSEISDVTASAAELNILDGATLDVTELNYVDGVTSSIQTQLNGKQTTLADAANIAYTDVGNSFSVNQTIRKTTGVKRLMIQSDDNEGDALIVSHAATAALIFQRANGDATSETALLSGEQFATQQYYGHNGTSMALKSDLRIITTENWGTNLNGSYFSFRNCATGSGTLTEQIRLLAGGGIGMKTTSRVYLDGVAGTGNDYLEATSDNNVLLNGQTTVALGVAGSNVFSSISTAITLTGTVAQSGKTITYNNINTAGIGNTTVFASFIGSSSSGSQSNIINYTPPSTAGTYRVSASIATTAATNTGTITITITYKDAAGIAKTI